MRHVHDLGARLSVLVLFALVGGLLFAACGTTTGGAGGQGSPTAQAPSGGTGSTPSGGTLPGGTSGGTPTSGTLPGGTLGGTPTTAVSAASSTTSAPAASPSAPVSPVVTTAATASTATTAGTTVPSVSTGTTTAGNTGGFQIAPMPYNPGSKHPDADLNAVLKYDVTNDVDTADPQVEAYVNDIAISSQVFAPLLTLTPDNKVAYNVAESMQVTNGGKTYTLKLRKTNYSDGQPATAKDYAYAMARACDPTVNGLYSNLLYAVKGCQKWREADTKKVSKDQLQKMQGVVNDSIKATDDYTLQIQLQYPAGYFPYVLTTWVTYPSRQDLVEKGGQNWWKNPQYFVGNGPFKVTKYTPKQEWVFERNDSYFRGKPGLKGMVFKLVNSPQTSFLAYKQGQFDILDSNNGPLSVDQVDQIRSDPTLKSQFKLSTAPITWYITFNEKDPPFNDEKVREAFSYAMNRDQYIKQIENGIGNPAGSFIPKGIPGYEDQFTQTYDPQKAKQLLADAGYPNGKGFPKVNWYYSSTSERGKKLAVYWSQQFNQALGVNIQPVPMDATEYQSLAANNDPKLKIQMGGWQQDFPHPQDWLTLVFGNGSGLAPLGWNDPTFNDMVNKADKLPLSQALPIYQKAGAYLAKHYAVDFLFNEQALMLVKPYVKGYVPYQGDPWGSVRASEMVYIVKH